MTSEEILAVIKGAFVSMNKDCEEAFNQIERDLEVLEILKEHFQLSEYGQWYIDMQESDFDFRSECSKEEWNNSPQKKIKEWLEK